MCNVAEAGDTDTLTWALTTPLNATNKRKPRNLTIIPLSLPIPSQYCIIQT
jgi:hypothetical protein